MESMFAHIPAPDRQLLKQKGYYPYSCMSDRSKFAERELPALSKWTNFLKNGKISINESELDKAKKMWQLLNCETMQDYHDSFLKLDVALLACCSEYCREIIFQTYRLDVAQFFTAPNMAKDAALRITKAREELSTDPEHLHMIEAELLPHSKRGTSKPTISSYRASTQKRLPLSGCASTRIICMGV